MPNVYFQPLRYRSWKTLPSLPTDKHRLLTCALFAHQCNSLRELTFSQLLHFKEQLRTYFSDSAYINWHCTNEHFTVEEYIQANCEYPGTWDGTIERIEQIGNLIITAVNVYSVDKTVSFHGVSFIKLKDDKIISLDEYWDDNGAPPAMAIGKKLGTKIHWDCLIKYTICLALAVGVL